MDKMMETGLNEVEKLIIKQSAKSLFKDCHLTWPLYYSQYYLGHIPPLNRLIPVTAFNTLLAPEKLVQSIHADWPLTSTCLTSHIYGDLMRRVMKGMNT